MLFYGQTLFFLQNSLSSYVNCLLIQSAQVDERLRSYGMELIIDTNPILYYILRYVPTYPTVHSKSEKTITVLKMGYKRLYCQSYKKGPDHFE